MEDKKILVPTDFTGVGDCAINHSVSLAQNIGAKVVLLHVIAKESQREWAESKLNLAVQDANKINPSIDVSFVVRVGTIFNTIPDTAEEVHAVLIVMGTHGMTGMQFIKGSYALKVVSKSKVPFVIVQNRPIAKRGYKNIVAPIDMTQETKQKLGVASNMAKYFDSTIHLFTPKEKDQFLRNKVRRNLDASKQYLHKAGIPFEAYIGDKKSGALVKDLLHFADNVDADLITVLNGGDASLGGLLGGGDVAQIIANEKQVPVMVVNPKTISNFWFG